MKDLQLFRCKRCGHDWASRLEKPMICPKCKSPYWDKEKVTKTERPE